MVRKLRKNTHSVFLRWARNTGEDHASTRKKRSGLEPRSGMSLTAKILAALARIGLMDVKSHPDGWLI